MNQAFPKIQRAVQLTGPDELRLNTEKPVFPPGPHQILAKVEAVGLCFSDLKLLKQFTSHVRKGPVVSGVEPDILNEIPSYVPGDKPTVPGHEVVVVIRAVGDKVDNIHPGERYLVQTDYRWIKTANSNAAFGYNFEGALQEYVLMDQRIITTPEGESMLIPAGADLSAAAVALVEPWACVEQAYAAKERQGLRQGGRLLVASEGRVNAEVIKKLISGYGQPAEIFWAAEGSPPDALDITVHKIRSIMDLEDDSVDDAVYFGNQPETIEAIFPKLAVRGLLNLVLEGKTLPRAVVTHVGKIHYGPIRIIGTTGTDPCASMNTIPATGEIRPGDSIGIIGAGGPMGVMHTIRNICHGVEGVSVYATDLDDNRLAALNRVALPLAQQNRLTYRSCNTAKQPLDEPINYRVLMVPVPALVADSIKSSPAGAIVNIFAGIQLKVTHPLDLQTYIEKRMYFIGTSGSTVEDMKTVLKKVQSRQLDTNLSVAAISGLDGAIDGIRAVEKQLVPGKILVYPSCKGLRLTPLDKLDRELPAVAAKLQNGIWTQEAEKALLEIYAG